MGLQKVSLDGLAILQVHSKLLKCVVTKQKELGAPHAKWTFLGRRQARYECAKSCKRVRVQAGGCG
jgi:hypothetical protein